MRNFPYVAFELVIAVVAGRYGYSLTMSGDSITAFAFYCLAALAIICAWVMLIFYEEPRRPRPPYGGVA